MSNTDGYASVNKMMATSVDLTSTGLSSPSQDIIQGSASNCCFPAFLSASGSVVEMEL